MVSSRLNPYERFFTLLYSLLGLVMSGARNIGWLNDKFQEIVNLPKPKELEVLGYSPVALKDLVNWWNDKFPRSGSAIVTAIGPLLSEEAKFRLERPRNNIGTLAQKAIFWKEISGIDIRIHTIQIAELGTDSVIEARGGNWGHWLHKDLKALMHKLEVEYGQHPWAEIHELSIIIGDRVRCGFERTPFHAEGYWFFRGSPWLSHEMEGNLASTMEYLIGAAVMGLDTPDPNPLTELWLTGNLPVGFTKDNKLILMCDK